MSRELDVKVAKALGCKVMQSAYMIGGRQVHYPACTCPNEDHADQHSYGLRAVKEYSTDIAAAFPLFEQLGPAWCLSQADSGGWDDAYRWWCWLPTEYGGDGTDYMAPTPSEAICLAFLAAKGKA